MAATSEATCYEMPVELRDILFEFDKGFGFLRDDFIESEALSFKELLFEIGCCFF